MKPVIVRYTIESAFTPSRSGTRRCMTPDIVDWIRWAGRVALACGALACGDDGRTPASTAAGAGSGAQDGAGGAATAGDGAPAAGAAAGVGGVGAAGVSGAVSAGRSGGGSGAGGGSGSGSGGAGSGSGSGSGGMGGASGMDGTAGASSARCDAAGLDWRSANKTHYTSYPDPGSAECIQYNGCTWAGQFAACDGQMPESWVQSHDIAALFPLGDYAGHDLCLRSGSSTLVVTAIDTCGDDDCGGCCTKNKGDADALVDLESYTDDRWGVADGAIEWADLGPNPDACSP